MKWFRLYSSVLHDPKVQRLSPALFKHWVNLLCLANETEPRGMLPAVDDIAFALRIKPSEAVTMLTQLRRAGLVDQTQDGRDFPHNWPQRQRKSDDVAARVGDHRERKAAQKGHSLDDGSGNVTLPVTLRKQPVDTEIDTDSELETDRHVTDDSESSGNSIIVADALASGASDDDDSAPHTPEDVSPSEPETTSDQPERPEKIAPDAPAMRLAIQLREAVLAHNSTAMDARKAMTGQGIQAWARKIESLISDPRRAPPDVEAVITYAASAAFWQPIVINPDKLKKHYDTINGQRLNALNARNGQNGGNGNGRHAANAENGRHARPNPLGSGATPARRFTDEYYARYEREQAQREAQQTAGPVTRRNG